MYPPLEIARVASDNADALAGIGELFQSYPYKTAQRLIQKLDRSRLNDLYESQIKRAVAAGEAVWTAATPEGTIAAGGLTPDPWHSEIYGFKMGKISPWLNTFLPLAGARILVNVNDFARTEGYHHLSVRLDGEDFDNLHLFETDGFHLIDVSLKFTRPMPLHADEATEDREGWFVRPSTPEDAEWMRELGSTTHGYSHFLNDPHLPREKTRTLFSAWVARCIEKLGYRIYVLKDHHGRGRGFVIYLRNEGFARVVGARPIILDYVILDPTVRGAGIGPWFVRESLKRENASGFDYCELRTSHHNLAAIGCYEKLGFRLCATDFVLHRKM